jgi:transposase
LISSQVEELIIQNYLSGHSRDEIAEETGVALGSVSNKVNEWKKRLAAPDIEELRRFAVNMKKSGITMKQCAKGLRFLQLLKGLEIIIENDDIDSDLDSLSFFVNDIYTKCKERGISPTVVTTWITDLMDFSTENYGYVYENAKNGIKMSSKENQTDRKEPLTCVSVISDFIEKKKKEIGDQSKNEKKISEEINQYELQKGELVEKIGALEQESQSIIVYRDTFRKLDNILLEECGIDLKKDLGSFTRLFSDFKENGYDVTTIVKEYTKAIKLRLDITLNESQIGAYQKQLTSLQNNIGFYQSVLDNNRKNWDIYQQLEVMKFGLKELKQLWLTVTEIATSRDKSRGDAVSIFIKDVEDNYYDKLQFEDRVKEKRTELAMLYEQINMSRQNLSMQPFIGPLLLSLYKKGITEQEITDMNQLFQEYLLETSKIVNNEGNKNESDTNVKNTVDKGRSYQTFIDELKKYGGIKGSIKHQSRILDEIKNETAVLIEQRKALLTLCQNVIILINMLNNHYFYYKGFVDSYHKKNNISIVTDRIAIPIIILVHNAPKEGQNSKEEKDTKTDTTTTRTSSNNDNNSNNNKK